MPTFCAGFRVFPPNVALQHCADHTFGRIADKTDDNATALALVLTIARGWICDQNLMGRAAQSGSNAMHCRPKLTYEAKASEALRTHFALSEPVAKGGTTVTGKMALCFSHRSHRSRRWRSAWSCVPIMW